MLENITSAAIRATLEAAAIPVIEALADAGFTVNEWDFPTEYTVRIKMNRGKFDANLWLRMPGDEEFAEVERGLPGDIYCCKLAIRDRALLTTREPLKDIDKTPTRRTPRRAIAALGLEYDVAKRLRASAKRKAALDALLAA